MRRVASKVSKMMIAEKVACGSVTPRSVPAALAVYPERLDAEMRGLLLGGLGLGSSRLVGGGKCSSGAILFARYGEELPWR